MTEPLETGWYRDPTHPDRHRYWDGVRWQSQAEHLQPADAPAAADGSGKAADGAARATAADRS